MNNILRPLKQYHCEILEKSVILKDGYKTAGPVLLLDCMPL